MEFRQHKRDYYHHKLGYPQVCSLKHATMTTTLRFCAMQKRSVKMVMKS